MRAWRLLALVGVVAMGIDAAGTVIGPFKKLAKDADLKGQVIAVDVASLVVKFWLADCPEFHRGRAGATTYRQKLKEWFYSVLKRGVKKLFIVIDGLRPAAKDAESALRRAAYDDNLAQARAADDRGSTAEADGLYRRLCGKPPPEVFDWLVAFCRLPAHAGKLEVIVSPGEADSQCAAMWRWGYVNGVITMDSDLVLGYRVGLVYLLDNRSHSALWKVELDELLRDAEPLSKSARGRPVTLAGLTPEELTTVAAAVGCDYFAGVHQMGWVHVVRLFQTLRDEFPSLLELRPKFIGVLANMDSDKGERARGDVVRRLTDAYDMFDNPIAVRLLGTGATDDGLVEWSGCLAAELCGAVEHIRALANWTDAGIIAQVLTGVLLPDTLQPRNVPPLSIDPQDNASSLNITEASAAAALAAVKAGGPNPYGKGTLVRWLIQMTNKTVTPTLRESDEKLLEEVVFVAGRLAADPYHFGCKTAQMEALHPWLSPGFEKPRLKQDVKGEAALQAIKDNMPKLEDGSVVHAYAQLHAARSIGR